MINDLTHIIIAFVLGFITGVCTCLILNKKNFATDKIISLLMIGMWAGMHSVAFFTTDLQVAWVFDVIGAGATGHIIGLDVIEAFSKIKRK